MALMAILAAVAGIMAGYWASSAAAGFGKNLREAMFVKIQQYSFKNIDKFSPASIVTRTTTDITNVQNAFMMLTRIAVLAPFMMVFAFVMGNVPIVEEYYPLLIYSCQITCLICVGLCLASVFASLVGIKSD